MKLEDVKDRIDDYFENVSGEEFLGHLESSGFVAISDDEDKCSNKSLVEQLKDYLDNATPEQLEKDYKELEDWVEIGPKIVEIDGELYLDFGDDE